jgi:hypothetical protein
MASLLGEQAQPYWQKHAEQEAHQGQEQQGDGDAQQRRKAE